MGDDGFIPLNVMSPSARISFEYLHPEMIMTQKEYENMKQTKVEHLITKPSKKIFEEVKNILKEYLDTSELNYNLLTTWALGTYFHRQFETFPLLTLMARKQSGKTRTLKLMSSLSCGSDGTVSTSITETFLFRHKDGSIFFDEFESISSKDKSALRELINSVYKKGNKITRYKETRKNGTKDYEEENFYPYYPLGLANIAGFGDVLSDRSLQIILQRSKNKQTKLIEDFSTNPEIISLKKELSNLQATIPIESLTEWNIFISTSKCRKELKEIFETISKTNLQGRPFEIFLPLFVTADLFGVLPILIKCSEEYLEQLEGEFVDNVDDLLQTFMEKMEYSGFVNVSEILSSFKVFLEEPEDWINAKWLGRALKRLGLISKKRLVNGRVQVLLNNNSTNTTIYTNTTNTTNTTEKKVELVDNVELKGLVVHNRKESKKEEKQSNNEQEIKILDDSENTKELIFDAKELDEVFK